MEYSVNINDWKFETAFLNNMFWVKKELIFVKGILYEMVKLCLIATINCCKEYKDGK